MAPVTRWRASIMLMGCPTTMPTPRWLSSKIPLFRLQGLLARLGRRPSSEGSQLSIRTQAMATRAATPPSGDYNGRQSAGEERDLLEHRATNAQLMQLVGR